MGWRNCWLRLLSLSSIVLQRHADKSTKWIPANIDTFQTSQWHYAASLSINSKQNKQVDGRTVFVWNVFKTVTWSHPTHNWRLFSGQNDWRLHRKHIHNTDITSDNINNKCAK